jgi:hypothetical protein
LTPSKRAPAHDDAPLAAPPVAKIDRLSSLPAVLDAALAELRDDVPRIPCNARRIFEAAVAHASLASLPSRHNRLRRRRLVLSRCTLGAKLVNQRKRGMTARKSKCCNLLGRLGG